MLSRRTWRERLPRRLFPHVRIRVIAIRSRVHTLVFSSKSTVERRGQYPATIPEAAPRSSVHVGSCSYSVRQATSALRSRRSRSTAPSQFTSPATEGSNVPTWRHGWNGRPQRQSSSPMRSRALRGVHFPLHIDVATVCVGAAPVGVGVALWVGVRRRRWQCWCRWVWRSARKLR